MHVTRLGRHSQLKARWLCSVVVMASDLQLDGCEFDYRPPCCQVTNLRQVVHTHLPLQVTVV